MAQIQAVWNKLNPRERLTAMGAGLVVLAWIVGLVTRGFGVGSLGLVGALAVLAVLYLKYTNSTINWPIAVPLITLAISGLIALFAVLTLIDYLGFLDVIGITALLALGIYVAGALLMAWGSWQEYQVEKPAMPTFGNATAGQGTASSGPAAASSTATPAAPATTETPTAAPPAADTDDTVPR